MAASLRREVWRHARAQWALAGLMACAAATFYAAWYRPATARLDALHRRLAADRATLAASTDRAAGLPALRDEVQRLRGQLEPFARTLPAEADLAAFMKDVTAIGQRTGVRRFTHQPGGSRAVDTLGERSVTIRFEGDFYKDVFTFLRETEEMQRATRVRSLSIKSKDPRSGLVEVEMAMNIYFAE